jgi:hypothetical protein
MRVCVNDQTRLFKSYWLPIQHELGTNLTEFVRHYLMKRGKILKGADVYFELKDRLANSRPADVEAFLRDLHRHGMFYAKFVEPTREADPEVVEKLDRLRRLKLTVAYPFLLRVFEASDVGSLSRDQLLEALDLLESFLLRRSICSIPSNQLRRMLPPVFDAAGGAGPSFIDGLRKQLGGKRCPNDEAFATALATEPLYSSAEKNTRLRLILERLERSFNHKEQAELSGAQIEHVMPQTLTPEWVQELGMASEEEAPQLIHTLGNLTLTKYNAELSNKPYESKRKELLLSHFELNRYFAGVERWSPDAILERGRVLAQRALGIWTDVGRESSTMEEGKQSSAGPKEIRVRGVLESVVNWKDAFVKLLKHFDASSPGLLQRIAAEQTLHAVIAMNGDRFRRSNVQIGEVFVNTHASAAQLKDWCRKVANIGIIKADDFEFVVSDEVAPGRKKQLSVPPVRVRFHDTQQPVVSWKDAYIKLLTQFDASRPGLLLSIAREQTMPAVIAMDPNGFRGSEVQIGGVYVNTHGSAPQLKDWCRRIARIGTISEMDFEFVTPSDSSKSTLYE